MLITFLQVVTIGLIASDHVVEMEVEGFLMVELREMEITLEYS